MSTRKYVVGRASDLADGERIIVTVNDRSIGIFNVGGRYYGLPNQCPHKGAEMCRGVLVGDLSSPAPGTFVYDAEKRYVTCPWHGWEFDVKTGQSYFDPGRTRVRTYAVDIEDGSATLSDLDAGAVNEAPSPADYVRMTQSGYTLREHGSPAEAEQPGRRPGPYSVETIKVDVEGDYLIVDLAPARPRRERTPRS